MSDPASALLTTLEATLRGSAALATAMGGSVRLYAGPIPTNAPLPYVAIGDDQVIDDSDECQDGSEIFAKVHAWSRPEPPSATQARSIAAAVRAALKAPIALEGFETVEWAFVDALHLTDPDGSTHVVLTFRYLVVPDGD